MNLLKCSLIIASFTLASCGTSPSDSKVVPSTQYSLPDTSIYLQKDPRWADDKMGSGGDTMGADGCLVTATAMVLTNLGYRMNPGELNTRFNKTNSYTSRGWLIWSGIEKVTNGRATAKYYDTVSDDIIQGCINAGFYPLVRFILPNGRTHWAMVLHRDGRGYHMRDPLHASRAPLIFPGNSNRFKAVRCVGNA